jgi:hypothetical protein
MDVEIAKLVLQGVSSAGVVVALLFTARQLQIAVAAYRDLHEWNRRKAAQEAISEYRNLSADTIVLDRAFRILSDNSPVPIETTLAAFAQDPEVRVSLHRVLNYFENLANGIRHKVLDDPLIKSYFRTNIESYLRQFEPYINHQRAANNVNACSELENLLNTWRTAERLPPVAGTGRG